MWDKDLPKAVNYRTYRGVRISVLMLYIFDLLYLHFVILADTVIAIGVLILVTVVVLAF